MEQGPAQGVTRGHSRARRSDTAIRLFVRHNQRALNGYTTECKEITVKTEAQSEDRDREATTGRFPLALFVVAEVLCTGALIGSVLLWG
jgi:hypothetical protein